METQLTTFEAHESNTNTAFNDFATALLPINAALVDGGEVNKECVVNAKAALLTFVRELASFDAFMPTVVDGWEVGLETTRKH